MGLFNNGKSEKAEKVEKSDKKQDATSSKPNQRPSKKHTNKFGGAVVRQMPQLSMMPNQFNPLPSTFGYPQMKYNFPTSTPYDLSKFIPSSTPFNPFMSPQVPTTNFAPMWTNGISPFNDRSPFQQQQQPAFNMYQQTGWPSYPPPTSGYMPPTNF
jgi:hypothetical protein